MADGKRTAEIQRLSDTGAHFAQVKSRRHPSMKPYLVGTKGRREIINLVKTVEQLEAAKGVMATLVNPPEVTVIAAVLVPPVVYFFEVLGAEPVRPSVPLQVE